jgi:hypothetical protein
MTPKTITIDVERIIALRDHHQREAEKYAAVLATLKDVSKLTKKADALMGKVRARAAADAPITGRARLVPAKRSTQSMTPAIRQRLAREAGTRPIDVIRNLFRAAGDDTVVTLDDVIKQSGVSLSSTTGRFGNRVSAEGATRRALGLVLSQLTKSRELKRTSDGWVARKIAPADVNGAHA